MTPLRIRTRFFVWLLLGLGASCGGGDTGPEETPTIGVTIGGPVAVVQGQSNSVEVTVTRAGGYRGVVGLAVEGLPAGVTGKFDPGSVPSGSGSGTSLLTLSATLGAALGSGTFTVTAAGAGVSPVTATGAVTVAEAPGFSMEVAPPGVSIEQGAAGLVSIAFTRRGGFNGPIALSLSGAPAGVTGAFDPLAPTGASAQLVLSVDGTVPIGTYALAVIGQGAPGTRTAGLTLTVTAPQPIPSFTIALAPSALTLQAGSSAQTSVTITRGGGFSGAVALSVAGQPAGVAATFDNNAPTGTGATLTLSAVSGVAPGNYNLVVRGSASGFADQVANLALTLVAAPGGFALAASPATVTLQVGQSAQSTITVFKTGGFSGTVSLSAVNLPAGVTAAFNPASASPSGRSGPQATDTQSNAIMTVSAVSSAVSGNYQIQVRGSSPGQPDQTVGMTLVVNPPPGSGNTTFAFCGNDLPLWFAARDGAGAWIRVMPATVPNGLTFSFDITAAGGAAFVTGSEFTGFTVEVVEGTRAELQTVGGSLCLSGSGGGGVLTGTVSGLGAADLATISLGLANDIATGSSPAFSLKGTPAGAADLIAVQNRQEAVGSGFAATPIKVIVRRAVNYVATIPALNFATEGFAPASAVFAIGNLGGDVVSTTTDYLTATTTAPFAFTIEAGGATQSVYGLPAGQQQAGDLHRLTVFAGPSGSNDGRTWIGWFRTLASGTITLAAPLGAPAVVAIAGSPYPRYQATGTVQAAYDDLMAFRITQALPDGTGRVWRIRRTRGLLGTSYTLVLPDLSSVAGWSPLWALQSGTAADWETTGTGITGDAILPTPADGAVMQWATRSGGVNP